MALTGLLLILIVDALMLLAADRITDHDLQIDSFWSALGVAFVAAAVTVVLDVVLGTNDDDAYTLRVIQRIARRSGERTVTDAPGIVFLEIDGLALPVLRRAMRDGNAPTMARWLEEGTHRLAEWETDLSSQTGASQAGILLGSNDDIPAFRWVEKETAKLVACSGPPDCAEIERRHASGTGPARRRRRQPRQPALGRGRRGDPDRQPDGRREAREPRLPGVLRQRLQRRHDARALLLGGRARVVGGRAARSGATSGRAATGAAIYPFLRATLCVVVRDLIVYGVLTDMMQGRPAIYATFSSYDEVAHHSGLERADTLEALRKLDQQFGRIERARPLRAASVRDRRALGSRADPGRDLQAAERLRARRARRALARARRRRRQRRRTATSNHACVGNALGEATGTHAEAEAPEERRLRPRRGRARLRQPRARLPDGGAPAADARGDRRAPPAPPPGPARASARRLAARPLRARRPGRARRATGRTTSPTAASRATTRSRTSRRTRRGTCCAPTASSTSPTSWSAASTTPRSTRAAPSRS